MVNKIHWDFAWGKPYFLLEILEKHYTPKLVPHDIKNMSYGPDRGLEKLIEITKKMIKDTTGLEYENIIITNGATQGINVLLRVLKKEIAFNGGPRFDSVMTSQHGFPYYGEMIKKAGFKRIKHESFDLSVFQCIRLIDSPSNPIGKQYDCAFGNNFTTIWDSVYHSHIYTDNTLKIPNHMAMVGSYSKLLGLTGARIGFIATNLHSLAKNCAHENLMENSTISIPSQELIIDIMEKIDLNDFIIAGRNSLNNNREEFRKIEYLFDNQPVPEVGMFYCVHADNKALEIIKKCGIKYVDLGDNFIRFSLGQTNQITKDGIKSILKEDKK